MTDYPRYFNPDYITNFLDMRISNSVQGEYKNSTLFDLKQCIDICVEYNGTNSHAHRSIGR